MKKEDKRELLEKYYKTLCNAWTYCLMTPTERNQLKDIKEWFSNCGVLDNLNTEKNIVHAFSGCYYSFLIGIGYTGTKWRENKETI